MKCQSHDAAKLRCVCMDRESENWAMGWHLKVRKTENLMRKEIFSNRESSHPALIWIFRSKLTENPMRKWISRNKRSENPVVKWIFRNRESRNPQSKQKENLKSNISGEIQVQVNFGQVTCLFINWCKTNIILAEKERWLAQGRCCYGIGLYNLSGGNIT